MELPKFKAVGLTWPYVVRRYLPKLFIAKCWVKKRSCIPFCKSQASVPSSCNAAAAPCPAPTAGADPFNTVPLQLSYNPQVKAVSFSYIIKPFALLGSVVVSIWRSFVLLC